MIDRRSAILLISALTPALAFPQHTAERALRSSIDAYLAAWARRDVDAWIRLHTEDTLYVDPYLNEKRGREQLAGFIGIMMRMYDVQLDVERLVVLPEGRHAIVIFRQRYGELPRNEGRYTRELDRSGIFSRWQLDADTWRVQQFIDSTTRSAEIIKELRL